MDFLKVRISQNFGNGPIFGGKIYNSKKQLFLPVFFRPISGWKHKLVFQNFFSDIFEIRMFIFRFSKLGVIHKSSGQFVGGGGISQTTILLHKTTNWRVKNTQTFDHVVYKWPLTGNKCMDKKASNPIRFLLVSVDLS